MKNDHLVKKILLPVDFSDNSLNACRYALKISRKIKSGLLLFHAYYSPALDLIELTGGNSSRKRLKEDVESNLLSEAEKEMNYFLEKMFKLPEAEGLKKEAFKAVLKLGSIKQAILSFAKEYQPDLVIMGTHGKNNSSSSFLGSITEFVISKLHHPVLAIPEKIGSISIDLKSILYLTDFDETDFQSIRKLLDLTQNQGVEIHCVHIGSSKKERNKLKLEGLIAYFKKVYDDYSFVYNVLSINEKKKFLMSVEEYINQNDIGIISLTHKQRNILKKYTTPNLTKSIFHKIKIPLLVFHP